MWNDFGLPGRSVENSAAGLLIVSIIIGVFLFAASTLYFLLE
jgi:hypothetical protein